MIKKVFFIFLLSAFVFCKEVTVAVAANVSYAMNELVKEFNKLYPDIKVTLILGSSGNLTAQIKHKAPYDVFMSADMKYPKILFQQKLALTKPKVYAKGAIVLFSTKKNTIKNINSLLNKKIKRVAIANPKTAPYGKAAFEVLKNSKIYSKIKSKLIYANSVSQTLSYTIKATDAGFVAKSALKSSKMKRFKKDIHWFEIDKNLYSPIKQGIVILKDTSEAKKFYDFILSKKAQKILKKFGYLFL